MRNKPIKTIKFVAVLLVAVSLLLIHPSASVRVSASAGQDPNATLPPPKPKPTPKKSVTPVRTPRRSSTSGAGNASADEIAFWNSIKDSKDPADFNAYLEQYPNGKFVALAKNRLKSLGAAQPASSTTRTASAPRAGTIVRNQIGMEMVLIPGGTFLMGSENGGTDEKPVHQVTISQPFYLGKYEVTQAQWQQVMGNNPSYFKNCDQCPVEDVSWNDAQEFIYKLNKLGDGYTYRLPTEAEWEYACRAGTTGDYAGPVNVMGWYADNSDHKTHPVGQKEANAFGLYDMHGNVWEWCEDWYHDSYNGAPTDGSAWESGGEQKYRVLRGGSWDDDAYDLRSADRYRDAPDYRNYYVGFRVVAVART